MIAIEGEIPGLVCSIIGVARRISDRSIDTGLAAELISGREVDHDKLGATQREMSLGPPALRPQAEGGTLTLATVSRKSSETKLSPAIDRAALCARVAADHKARDIVVLDMRGITPLYDFFVIATGNSRRQIHTLAEEIDASMRAEGDRRLAIEGYESSKWVVQDYGDIVVHVFEPETREYYNLEDLWADAGRVDWERY